MKRALLALALAAALPLSASAAEGISYSYAEVGYAKNDAKDRTADSDGWAINGSYAFHPNFHAFAGYSKQKVDSFTDYSFVGGPFNLGPIRFKGYDVDSWHVGVGYNHELSQRVDLVARLAYEQRDYDFGWGYDGKLKGGSAEVGVRGSLAPNWEGYAFAGYQDFDSTYVDDGKFYGRIGTQVKFNQHWGITADAKFLDGGHKEFFIGPRFSF